ncbi:hypothetical protein ABZ897_51850 [Nonomuraea sp. NPDC046802]|uniref:hypothetical protein n=1 Tax=Nonomuraea sp. NPDC046802 TaxID=3154919 RepID=UPI00340ECCCC
MRKVTPQHEGLTQIALLDLGYTRHMLQALFDLPIPEAGEGRLASPDLSQADPGVCRADGAILYGKKKKEKYGVIVETQRSKDETKHYSWLEYIANFRAREKCPVCLVVLCPDPEVARWAEKAITTGHPGLELIPKVIHPGNTPVITDVAQMLGNIGLAVLSTIMRGNSPEGEAIFEAMLAALDSIDRETAWRYARYINVSLTGDEQKKWESLMAMQTYPYQGDYAEGLLAQGRAEGEAETVLKFLQHRGVAVSDVVRERVMACRDEATLDRWVMRAPFVSSAEELFD